MGENLCEQLANVGRNSAEVVVELESIIEY